MDEKDEIIKVLRQRLALCLGATAFFCAQDMSVCEYTDDELKAFWNAGYLMAKHGERKFQ